MTETARMADIVLRPRCSSNTTTSITGGGQQHLQFGPKLIDPPGECRSNHEVFAGLATRSARNIAASA